MPHCSLNLDFSSNLSCWASFHVLLGYPFVFFGEMSTYVFLPFLDLVFFLFGYWAPWSPCVFLTLILCPLLRLQIFSPIFFQLWIGVQLLYSLVLVSAVKQYESSVSTHVSLLSRACLPASPSTLPGLHRAPGLAPWGARQLHSSCCFTLGSASMSVPLLHSPRHPLSSLCRTDLLCTCASPFLPCRYFCLYVFFYIACICVLIWASLGTQLVKNLPAVQETLLWFLGQDDPQEEGMTTHSSLLAWRIPWTEEPGGLQFMGSQSQSQLKWLRAAQHTHVNIQCLSLSLWLASLFVTYSRFTCISARGPVSFLLMAE